MNVIRKRKSQVNYYQYRCPSFKQRVAWFREQYMNRKGKLSAPAIALYAALLAG